MEPGKCSSCGADIFWVRTESGKIMPLDAVPVDPCKVNRTCITEDGVAKFGAFDLPPNHPRYVPHFATCPNAAQHRKRTRQ